MRPHTDRGGPRVPSRAPPSSSPSPRSTNGWRDGDRIESITGPLGGTIQVDSQLDAGVFAPALAWVADVDVLGGHWGAFVLTPFQNPGVHCPTEGRASPYPSAWPVRPRG